MKGRVLTRPPTAGHKGADGVGGLTEAEPSWWRGWGSPLLTAEERVSHLCRKWEWAQLKPQQELPETGCRRKPSV